MNLDMNKTVSELALEFPAVTRVFESVGIDYCCGGQRTLADACSAAGVKVEHIQGLLTTDTPSATLRPDFTSATLDELITHIVTKHHSFTRLELARLTALLEKVCAAHGANHPELLQINCLFHELGADLETHMLKEERVLFPYVVRLEASAAQNVPLFRPAFGTVNHPVRMMMIEHDRAGELLREIRTQTANFTAPADASVSYQTLYRALQELEADLHQHIHLENNLLFPKAIEMEKVAVAI